MHDITLEAEEYRAGRDDINALGDVLSSKPREVQSLFDKELEYDFANRQKFYDKFGPERFEAELEAAIVERFESERDE